MTTDEQKFTDYIDVRLEDPEFLARIEAGISNIKNELDSETFATYFKGQELQQIDTAWFIEEWKRNFEGIGPEFAEDTELGVYERRVNRSLAGVELNLMFSSKDPEAAKEHMSEMFDFIRQRLRESFTEVQEVKFDPRKIVKK